MGAWRLAQPAAILADWVGCGDAEIHGGGSRDGGDLRDGRGRARQCSRIGPDLRTNRASRADARTPFWIQRTPSAFRAQHAWESTMDRAGADARRDSAAPAVRL